MAYCFPSFWNWQNWPLYLLFISTESLVGRQAGLGSQLTVSVTSTWFWSAMLRVRVIFKRRGWKEQRLIGWAWAVTGVKTGNLTLFLPVNPSLSGLQAVTDVPPPHGTLFLPIGSSVKPSPGKISESRKWTQLAASFLMLIQFLQSIDFLNHHMWFFAKRKKKLFRNKRSAKYDDL